MFKICLSILRKKKKEFFIILAISSALSIISAMAFTAAKDISLTKKNEGFLFYGSFIAAGATEDENDIPVSEKLKIGSYKLDDEVEIKDTSLYVGRVDENFYELTSCSLLEGTYPKGKNEIAVESFVLKLTGKKINDALSLNLNGNTKEYIITGILKNYSMTMSTGLDKASASYPSIIVGDEYNTNEKKTYYLLGYSDRNTIGYDVDKEIDRLHSITGALPNCFYNDNLFSKGFLYCSDLENFSGIFNVVIFILAGIVCVILYFFFFKNLKKNQAIFAVLGDTGNIKRIAVLELILVSIASFLLSMGLLSVFLRLSFWDNIYIFKIGITFLCIWHLSFAVLEILMCLLFINKFFKNTVRENLRQTARKLKKSSRVKDSLLIITKYLSIFIICFLSVFYVNVLEESFLGLPDYQMISREAFSSDIIKGYNIKRSEGTSYSIGEVNNIINRYENINAELVPNTYNSVLVFEKNYNNDFLKEYVSLGDYEAFEEEDNALKEDWPKEADNYTPITDVRYLVVSKKEYSNIKRSCGMEEGEDGLIMYVPTDYDPKIDETQLGFAGFLTDLGLSFKKYELGIGKIINKDYTSCIEENTKDYSGELFSEESNEIVVFLSYDKLSEYPIVNGYDQIYITFNSDFHEWSSIDDDLAYLQSKVQGGVLYSKKEDERRAVDFNRYIKGISAVLVAVSIGIAFIYSVAGGILYIKNNRKRLGIQMILGKLIFKLVLEKFVSNVSRLFVSVLIAIVIIVVFVFDGQNVLLCLTGGSFALCLAFLIMLSDIVIYGLFLKKVNLKDCIA